MTIQTKNHQPDNVTCSQGKASQKKCTNNEQSLNNYDMLKNTQGII